MSYASRNTSRSSFVKQAAILAAATLFARFVGFLYRLPLTYLIGDAGNALYAVGYQFYLFLLVLSSAGLPNAVSKMVSERIARGQYKDAHGVFKTTMVVAVILGGIGSLLLWVFAQHLAIWFRHPGSVYAIRAVAPAVLIVAVMAVYRGYFQGMNNAVPTALSQVIEQLFNAIFKVFLAYLFISQLEHAAAGATAGTVIGAVLGLVTLLGIYKLLSPKIHARVQSDDHEYTESPKQVAKEVLGTMFPIIMGAAIYSMANFIDLIMVPARMEAAHFTRDEINILYGQLTGKFVVLTTLPVSVSTALSMAVMPSIAGSNVLHDKQAVLDKISKALRLSMLISIPSAIGMAVLAGPILMLLFPSHPEGAVLLQVGAVSVIFLSMVQVATGALQGIGKIMIPVIGAATGAIVKVPLNYVLIAIPEINVIGAVISTCICYFLAMLVNWGALKRYTGVKIGWVDSVLKPLFAAAAMGLSCYVSYFVAEIIIGSIFGLVFGDYVNANATNAVSTLFAMGVGVLVFFSMLIMVGGVYKEDLARIPLLKRLSF